MSSERLNKVLLDLRGTKRRADLKEEPVRLSERALASDFVTEPPSKLCALEMDERFPGLRAAFASERERLVEELLDRIAGRRSSALEEGAGEG